LYFLESLVFEIQASKLVDGEYLLEGLTYEKGNFLLKISHGNQIAIPAYILTWDYNPRTNQRLGFPLALSFDNKNIKH